MRYFIVSQNLVKSRMKFPKNTILRVNLAWHKNLNSIRKMLRMHKGHDIFLDIPVGRKKPPNHKHDIDNITKIANIFDNVRYVAVSNVEGHNDITPYLRRFKAKVVPKIESLKGVRNLNGILDAMNYKPQIIMLDHEDLFSNLVLLKKETLYLDIMKKVREICKKRRAHLLRVKGIIFTDD